MLELPNGVLRHHLSALARARLVTIRRIGRRTFLFPIGVEGTGRTSCLSRFQREFLDVVRSEPGMTQRGVARRTGLSERAVSYHVAVLAREGVLEARRDGNTKRCYAVPAP